MMRKVWTFRFSSTRATHRYKEQDFDPHLMDFSPHFRIIRNPLKMTFTFKDFLR